MTKALENPRLLSLAAGFTDNQTLPVGAVSDAVAKLARRPGAPDHLQYGSNTGRLALRRLLGERLRKWEPDLSDVELAEHLFVTNGSQQALYLAMQALCDDGDIVLVDRPSYFVFLEMLAGFGVRARSLPVNGEGRLNLAGADALLQDVKRRGEIHRIKAVYFVSYYSNPSGRSLDAWEKTALGELLRRHGLLVPVVEDAAYRDLYFRSAPNTPGVITMEAWRGFPCLYLATLTKSFATGLKIGYGYCTHADWLARMLHLKGHQDFGTSNFNQAICEEVLGSGTFDRHLAVVRPAYERKMHALEEALVAEGLRELGWQWSTPEGGLYLWLRAPASLDTSMDAAFCRACAEEGVLYVPGDLCFGDDIKHNCVRLSYGTLDADCLREAGRRFSRVARQFSSLAAAQR